MSMTKSARVKKFLDTLNKAVVLEDEEEIEDDDDEEDLLAAECCDTDPDEYEEDHG